MKWCWFRLDSSVASQPCPPTPSRAHNPGLRCRSGWRRLECTDESALSVTITSPDCRSAARSVTPVTAHTLSPHTQKRSSIKPSSLLPKEFVFASLWKRTSYSRIELAAHSGPVLFCAPSGSSPTVFAFSRCGAELTDSPLRSSSTAELLWEGQSKASGFPRWRRAFHSFHNLHKLGACVRLEPCAF